MDRLFAPFVTAAAFSLALAGYLLLINYDGSPAMSVLIPILIGIAGGAEVDVTGYLTARYFGLCSFSALYGLIQGCNSVFYGVAPMIAALLYDRTGSYTGMLSVLSGALVVSVTLIATLGRYPDFGLDNLTHGELPSGGFATDSTPTLVG
ncbi:MAG: hypothetical protein JOY99_11585 [Sphingomonadaceae bacterium]|nr:hypothetical protein [Sphingomonadaceae bacterium]